MAPTTSRSTDTSASVTRCRSAINFPPYHVLTFDGPEPNAGLLRPTAALAGPKVNCISHIRPKYGGFRSPQPSRAHKNGFSGTTLLSRFDLSQVACPKPPVNARSGKERLLSRRGWQRRGYTIALRVPW